MHEEEIKSSTVQANSKMKLFEKLASLLIVELALIIFKGR